MSAHAKNGNGHAAAHDDPPPVGEAPPEPKGAELRHRLDQMGTILAKGLDLAEAGVSLGVTIIGRVGAAAQQKLREGLDAAAQPATAAEPQAEQAPVAEPEYGLTNRLPLAPGGTVRISFSVNNDSLTEPKKVELRVEGFAGDTQGARLDPAQFTIKPAQKTIAPVDFEKFVLQGPVAGDVPPDVYRGAVVVESGTSFRIPVVLVVTPL
ncbi:MAG TPA: hypothetical protein VMU01_03230 [Rhizomicrobium sp.]|nr:hypothetical protein [Rhizomicrobium sp.]